MVVPPYISNLENYSSLSLFLASSGKYFAKPSLGESCCDFHFFNHRFTQSFETDLEIYGDGGGCFNFGNKHGTAKY